MLFQNGGKGIVRKVSTKEKKRSVKNNQPIEGFAKEDLASPAAREFRGPHYCSEKFFCMTMR
jgi:hypothetical protein